MAGNLPVAVHPRAAGGFPHSLARRRAPRATLSPVPSPTRHPKLGYALAAAAATLWAANGSVSRLLLDDGVSAMRLSELRAVLTFRPRGVPPALARPRLPRVRREHLPRLAFLGIAGLAGVTAPYFFSISRLDIG